jgi:hypothetical protein
LAPSLARDASTAAAAALPTPAAVFASVEVLFGL